MSSISRWCAFYRLFGQCWCKLDFFHPWKWNRIERIVRNDEMVHPRWASRIPRATRNLALINRPIIFEITPSMICLILPMLIGLQQLSPIPCQMTTGTAGSAAFTVEMKSRADKITTTTDAILDKIKISKCCPCTS